MKAYQLPRKRDFEKKIKGKKAHLIVLKNNRGMQAAVSDYGARVVSILIPDREGTATDIALGFNTIEGYLNAEEPYYGVTVGRFANRIAKGAFMIGEESFQASINDGLNALHGGREGFHQRVWDRRVNDCNSVEFYLVSPDGEDGFPGKLTVTVEYSLTDNNELIINYRAHSDKKTIINLSNHTFFNLNGEGSESIVNHEVVINADQFLPVDEHQIPTGELQEVEGGVFDFRKAKSIAEAIKSSHPQIVAAGGIDHNFALNKSKNSKPAAKVFSPLTGIQMEVFTTEPGLQFYTANHLSGNDKGKTGTEYPKYSAFCMETQKFPDSPNQKHFPPCKLEPDEVFTSQTRYRFSVKK